MPIEVIVRCDEMIAVDAEFRQPWSDVLIRFSNGSAHREFDLTLIAQPTLERDLRIEREKVAAHPERDRKPILRLESFLESLNLGRGIVVDFNAPGGPIRTVYTSSSYIDRAIAEEMLRFLLETQGVADVRFTWLRPEYPLTTGPWP
jgi:hypothetical protein